MSQTVGMTTTNYTWDVAASLPVVLKDDANSYVYGLDRISPTDGLGQQTYFVYDGLGSTTALTGSTTDIVDGSANVTATYRYDVFGAIRSQTGSSPNDWLFTGEQRDGTSSLYYLRARYYDPALGRFLSLDPLGEGNGYSYASNNPVNLTDPAGLCAICDAWYEQSLLGEIGAAATTPTDLGDLLTVAQVVLSSSPIVGDLNDAIAYATGYDIIWGTKLTDEERIATGAALLLPIIPGFASRNADEGLQAAKAARGIRGGETAAAAFGRHMHQELKEKILAKGGNWRYAPPLRGLDGKLYRQDVVTPAGHIFELKPNTVLGRLAGARQIAIYQQQLQMRGRVIYYAPPP